MLLVALCQTRDQYRDQGLKLLSMTHWEEFSSTHKHSLSVFTHILASYVFLCTCQAIFPSSVDAAHMPESNANSSQLPNMATHLNVIFSIKQIQFLVLSLCLSQHLLNDLLSPFTAHATWTLPPSFTHGLVLSFCRHHHSSSEVCTFLINFAKRRNVFGFLINRGWGLSVLREKKVKWESPFCRLPWGQDFRSNFVMFHQLSRVGLQYLGSHHFSWLVW